MKLNQVINLEDAARAIQAGGPGSGRHKGTGMTDHEFTNFAKQVGTARNATRGQEDALHGAGKHDEANALYDKAKENVKGLLKDNNVQPKAFDDHMKQISRSLGVRAPNVKMANMFPKGV